MEGGGWLVDEQEDDSASGAVLFKSDSRRKCGVSRDGGRGEGEEEEG